MLEGYKMNLLTLSYIGQTSGRKKNQRTEVHQSATYLTKSMKNGSSWFVISHIEALKHVTHVVSFFSYVCSFAFNVFVFIFINNCFNTDIFSKEKLNIDN